MSKDFSRASLQVIDGEHGANLVEDLLEAGLLGAQTSLQGAAAERRRTAGRIGVGFPASHQISKLAFQLAGDIVLLVERLQVFFSLFCELPIHRRNIRAGTFRTCASLHYRVRGHLQRREHVLTRQLHPRGRTSVSFRSTIRRSMRCPRRCARGSSTRSREAASMPARSC